jgi:hypothetical protein
MPKIYYELLKNILNKPDTVAVLSTINGDGTPHTTVLESARLTDSGALEYLELLESSRGYRNLTASLWFNKTVSALVSTPDGVRYLIKGAPDRITVCGAYFEDQYRRIRESRGDVDLAAVCSIKILEIEDDSFAVKFVQQESARPFYKHLDRITHRKGGNP